MIARAWIALGVLASSSAVQAQAPHGSIVVEGCTDAEEREIIELLRMELGDGVEFANEPSGERIWFSQACSPRADIRYSSRDGAVSREVELSEVDRALRPRVLALAGAELVRGRDDEAVGAGEPLRIGVGPIIQVFTSDGTALFGGEVGIEWGALSLGVLGSIGGSSDSLGTASYRRLHAFALLMLLNADAGRWSFGAGPHASAGATFGVATPTQAALSDSTVDATADFGLEGALALRIGAGWLARLCARAGYAIGPRFSADTRALATLRGPYVGASLHIGLALASER